MCFWALGEGQAAKTPPPILSSMDGCSLLLWQAIQRVLRGSAQQQTQEYVRFTNSFGTHYITAAKMGASLIVQQEFQVRISSFVFAM